MAPPPSAFYDEPSSSASTSRAEIEDDDWETTYSRNESSPDGQSANARLWQDANAPPTKPLYIISASSSNPSSNFPPVGALAPPKPALQILKRPSSAASTSSSISNSNSNATPTPTLKDREKAYEEARMRIMGSGSGRGSPTSASAGVETKKESSGGGKKEKPEKGIVRNPRAPPTGDGNGGFAQRRAANGERKS